MMNQHYRYFIVGGGLAAASAVEGIRQVDAHGSIGLISEEQDPPYKRPLLSKGLWAGKPMEAIWRKTAEQGVDLILGRRVTGIDATERCATDDQGQVYTYEKLLLATGGAPRRLPFGSQDIVYYRTLEDYRRLREQANGNKRFAVIGGGFIGSEIAAALRQSGQKVVMVFPEEGIGARVFPAGLSQFVNEYYRQKGVEVLTGKLLSGLERGENELHLITQSGEALTADEIVAGIGITPNTSLAEAAGLAVSNGIEVDRYLRSSQPDIYSAGDAANFFNPHLGNRLRVEHEDNAVQMGKTAGLNMAGQDVPYDHLPFFYSDLFDLGYEAVGELDSRLETFEDWQDPYHKGVVYYLKDERVRGVLLWNVWDKVPAARDLIADPGPWSSSRLKGIIQ